MKKIQSVHLVGVRDSSVLDEQVYIKMASDGRSKLLSFAIGRLHRHAGEDAEDCVSEALQRAWAHREECENTRTYIFGAIIQACLNRNRGHGQWRFTSTSRYARIIGINSKGGSTFDMQCNRSDTLVCAQIREIVGKMPIAARERWSEALVGGSYRIDSRGIDSIVLKGRVSRERKRLKEIWLQAPMPARAAG